MQYYLDEDPKTLKVFPIPLRDSSGTTLHYDRLSISPDRRILAATHGSTLQWLCAETGKVLDTADKAHDGMPVFKFFAGIFLLSFSSYVILTRENQFRLHNFFPLPALLSLFLLE